MTREEQERHAAAEQYALSLVPEPTTANIGVRALASAAFEAGWAAAQAQEESRADIW